MGYSEIMCQLCFVSFAIARIRTAKEPPEAAWAYHGADFVDNYAEEDCDCEPFTETGCALKARSEGDEEGEHLAGPGCQSTQGYSGARISLEEMQGCRAVRALIRKDDQYGTDWEDEDDDEPWERQTKYFFSGTGDGSPDEGPLEDLDRERHDVTNVLVSNTNDDFGYDVQYAIPVHPWCWEVFKRVSLCRTGFIDVHGLWRFRSIEGDYKSMFERFPRHPAVRAGYEQWWCHEPGSEWLVANPVAVPDLARVLESDGIVINKANSESFDVNMDAFKSPLAPMPGKARTELADELKSNDPIAALPPELRMMIVGYLDSKSIAAARLVFHSLRSIPIIAFRRLVLQEMPWFWEAENMPPALTNWHRLFMQLKHVLSDLKGIKNRVRIWKDINEIMSRVQKYRAKGKIRGVTGWEDDADEGGDDSEDDSDHNSDNNSDDNSDDDRDESDPEDDGSENGSEAEWEDESEDESVA